MTDEEMAEEYANENWEHYEEGQNDSKALKQAFLAGLKASRPQWHYVKDELPPIKKEYNGRSEPVLVLSKEKEMQYAQYVEKEKTWARGICEINFKPYAWKEIELPKELKND
jgi:hypothetical protein